MGHTTAARHQAVRLHRPVAAVAADAGGEAEDVDLVVPERDRAPDAAGRGHDMEVAEHTHAANAHLDALAADPGALAGAQGMRRVSSSGRCCGAVVVVLEDLPVEGRPQSVVHVLEGVEPPSDRRGDLAALEPVGRRRSKAASPTSRGRSAIEMDF